MKSALSSSGKKCAAMGKQPHRQPISVLQAERRRGQVLQELFFLIVIELIVP